VSETALLGEERFLTERSFRDVEGMVEFEKPASSVKHILGIEGGGSHTVAALLDPRGEPLHRATFPTPSNLAALQLPHELAALVSEMRAQFRFEPCSTRVVSGFAGAGTSDRISAAVDTFRALGFVDPSVVVSDSQLTLEALGAEGVVFIAGTGSICLGRKGAQQIRHGGNGYLLGDEASGFYVGRRALNEILDADYCSQRPTAMTPLVLRHFGLTRPEQLKDFVYGDTKVPKPEIAGVAPIVFACAADGDPIAAAIIAQAVEEMARSIQATREALTLQETGCALGLRGGLFRGPLARPLLIDPLNTRIAELGTPVSIRVLESENDPYVILIPAVRSILNHDGERTSSLVVPTPRQRDTEKQHPHSLAMDAMTSDALLELFNRGNQEVFEALLERDFLIALDAVADRIRAQGDAQIVLGGAGTSGRIAYYLAKQFEGALSIRHWIAGGPRAITEAVEGAEDNTVQAMEDVVRLLDGSSHPHFIGISCGLSAPCVASALVAARNKGAGLAVLGMTPVETARADTIPGAGVNFAQVLRDLRTNASDRYSELTVCAGPEVLTGSSRLKGGTATWIALYSLLEGLRVGKSPSAVLGDEVRRLRSQIVDPTLARAVDRAGHGIRSGGSIIYVAEGVIADAAALDASEIAPTFGVSPDRVRVVRFDSVHPSSLVGSERDLVVYLGDCDSEELLAKSIAAPSVRFHADDFITAKINVLNPLSTAAFVRAGYVFGNRMLNVRPSNSKLFERATGIVAEIAGVDLAVARRSLIAVMIDTNEPTPEDLTRSPEELCRHAKGLSYVVPRAIVHALGGSLEVSNQLLTSSVALREIIAQCSLSKDNFTKRAARTERGKEIGA
jgi:N-acetylmuramic acid 6-phosphate (MurNAc-6-P) etherase/N-acetylglucosamine kinase-like BadF-type ATPase